MEPFVGASLLAPTGFMFASGKLLGRHIHLRPVMLVLIGQYEWGEQQAAQCGDRMT